jgi:phosphatidylinositol alpha-1,6-mannosyltransferase
VLPRLPQDVEFRVVGAPWNAREVAALRAAPRTAYLGRVPDAELQLLRRQATVTVMPNRSAGAGDIEGFGLAALEAVAGGSFLVAAGIEGIVDAVVDGTTGFLLPAGDAEAWASKLTELLDWPAAARAQFLAQARQVLAAQFSWHRVAAQTLAAIDGGRRGDG